MTELESNTSVETTEAEEKETKTYTREEVEKLLQAETDRRVTSALKKQEQKNLEKVKEAQKLAQMNESEKYRYELDKREQAIIQKEKELALLENKNVASKILAEKGLSLDLVDFVVTDSAEDMDANIKRLDKAFKLSVKAEVEKRMGSATPKNNLPIEEGMTKEKFRKLPVVEQQKLLDENPSLIKGFYD